MKLAVVGATGLVGSEILEVLAEHNFPFDELLLVASERSVGKQIDYKGKPYTVIFSRRKHIYRVGSKIR